MSDRNTPESFWRCADRSDGCWLWNRPVDAASRYPRIRFGGRRIKAHRCAWELSFGPVPEGMHVLHRCDVTTCVRPDHLFLGTHADNMADKAAKGRVVAPSGEANPLARITGSEALAIRYAVDAGRSQTDVAREFGLDQTHVSRIVRGQAWAAVGGPLQRRQNAGRKPKETIA